MENDLTKTEKFLLRSINIANGTNYNYKHLMEWSNSKSVIEKNLNEGEKIYQIAGIYVAIKTNN